MQDARFDGSYIGGRTCRLIRGRRSSADITSVVAKFAQRGGPQIPYRRGDGDAADLNRVLRERSSRVRRKEPSCPRGMITPLMSGGLFQPRLPPPAWSSRFPMSVLASRPPTVLW